MPLYQFEITIGDATEMIEVECKSAEHMRVEALRTAVLGIRDLREDFWGKPRWALRVTDESNMSLLSLTFTADL